MTHFSLFGSKRKKVTSIGNFSQKSSQIEPENCPPTKKKILPVAKKSAELVQAGKIKDIWWAEKTKFLIQAPQTKKSAKKGQIFEDSWKKVRKVGSTVPES